MNLIQTLNRIIQIRIFKREFDSQNSQIDIAKKLYKRYGVIIECP